MSRTVRFIKKFIPNSIKVAIKRRLNIPEHMVLGEGPPCYPGASISNHSYPSHPDSMNAAYQDSIVRIAIHAGGGMGDMITYLPILDQLMSICDCTIDFYTDELTYASAIYMPRANLRILSPQLQYNINSYDMILDVSHCCVVKTIDFRAIHKKAPMLYPVIEKIQRFNRAFFVHVTEHGTPALALRQSKFLAFNRWTYLSADGAFEMNDQRSSVFIDMNHLSALERYGLHEKQYLVVNRSADPRGGGCRQTKVWPKEKYEDFVSNVKERFPEIKIIQVIVNRDPEISGIDCAIRNAEIGVVKVILKHAVAFIGSEGGIAHLATQMSTPSVVAFGPTPEHYYGYMRNVNIVSPYCSDCMEVMPDWYTICPRGYSTAKCMEAISGEMVASAVGKIVDGRKQYRYDLTHSSIYSSEELEKFKPVIKDIVRENSMEPATGSGHIFGPVRVYIHASKRWEYPYILEQINAHGKKLKIADVGAGRGALSLYLAKKWHDVTVFDMDYNWDNNGETQIHNRFMRYCAEKRVKAKIATGFNLPEDDDSFDVVISTSVIEHVVHKKFMLAEMLRVLKPGGILILTYDLVASGANTFPEASRVEVLTPSMLRELLAEFKITAEPYCEDNVAKSLADIHSDNIDILPGVTVGGCVIKKVIE